MVKIYKAQVGASITEQHQEILDWLNKHEKFKDSYVLLEFQPPGRGMRQIDMVILLSNRICLLELKGHNFTKIRVNDFWYYFDERSQEEKKLGKNVRGKIENPYNQTINTANSFKWWIKSKKEFSDSTHFSKFLESEELAIFPIVYIRKTSYLEESDIELHNWCFLAKGVEELEQNLSRTWRLFEGQEPYMDIEFIKDLIEELSLITPDSAIILRRGKDNTTLIAIMDYLSEYSPKWSREEQVKTDVFDSGEKRISEVRKALSRGKKEGLLITRDEFYELSPYVSALKERTYSMEEIYSFWPHIMRLDKERMKNPTLFEFYIKETYPSDTKQDEISESESSYELNQKIPDSLLIYSFDDYIRFKEKLKPVVFRMGGPLWIDYQKDLVLPFYDLHDKEVRLTVLEHIQNNKNVLIHGSASSGKTTLVKSIGLSLLKEGIPVILLTPLDLDREALNSILRFEKQNLDEKKNNLVVIIENAHLATPTEAHWLKRFLKPLKGIQTILTSRKENLEIIGENLFEVFDQEEEFVKLNLDLQIDLTKRVLDLTTIILSLIIEDLDDEQLKQLSGKIVKRNADSLVLTQIEIEAAIQLALIQDIDATGIPLNILDLVNKEYFLELLETKDKLKTGVENRLIERFENYKEQILQDIDVPLQTVNKALILIFEYCLLELPLRSDLIADVGDIELEHINKILRNLEQRGEILSSKDGYLMPHPLYAEKMVNALETTKQEYKTLMEEMIEDLSDCKGETLPEKIMHNLYEKEPSLKSEWVIEEEIQEYDVEKHSMISLERLKELAPELMIEDFVNLIYKVPRIWYGINYKEWWEFWDDIGLNELNAMINNAASLKGIMYLLREINQYKWPKFDKLLNQIEPDVLLDVDESNRFESLFELLVYAKKWGYTQVIYLEVEGILRFFFQIGGYRRHIFGDLSVQSYEIIDNLNPSSVLEEYQSNSNIRIDGFLDFLRDAGDKHQKKSVLRDALMRLILKDGLQNTTISLLCSTINHINSGIKLEEELFAKEIFNWNLTLIHDVFIEVDRSWLRFFIEIIANKKETIIIELINSLTVEEVYTILFRDEAKDEDEYWERLFFALEKADWISLGLLLDRIGHPFFENYFINPEKTTYFDFPLMKLLLRHDWGQKSLFVKIFDFYSWSIRQDFHIFKNLVEIFNSVGVEENCEIVKHFFNESMTQEWPGRNLSEIIELCNDMGVSWSQWVDIDLLKDRLEKRPHIGIKLIEILEKNGWKIPAAVEKSLSEYEVTKEKNLWERMTLRQRADYLYNQEGKKDEGIKLYQKLAIDLSQAQNITEIRTFLIQIQALETEEIQKIVEKLSPPLSKTFVDFKDYWEVEKIMEIFWEIDYPYLPEFLVNIYERIYTSNENAFWEKQESYKLDEEIRQNILALLWKRSSYEKILRLPQSFDDLIQSDKDRILTTLSVDEEDNPFLWDILIRIYDTSPESEKTEIHKLMLKIIVTHENLFDINQILVKQQPILQMVIKELPNLEELNIKEMLDSSSVKDIIHFFKLLEDKHQVEVLKKVINLLKKEEWETKLNASDLTSVHFLRYWIAAYFMEELSFDQLHPKEIKSVFSRIVKRKIS